MDLISITDFTDDYIAGWLSNEDQYSIFEIVKGGEIRIIKDLPKHEYKSYSDFAEIIGKFNPYTFFFRQTILIDPENFDGVKAAYEKHVSIHGEPL